MSFSLLPKMMADSLTDITPEQLSRRGIRLLMLDFDNTIVPYTTDVPTGEMSAWLERMNRSDIRVCIVSNSKHDRVPKFCRERGLECVTHARKPLSKGIRECLERFGTAPEESALVGDQIYTDTLGANCAGVNSILIRAIDNHNFWLKARHVLELPFIWVAGNRKI